MDNNGVIQKSKDARREYGQASENERKELSDLSEWIETAVGKIEYNEELKALKPGDYIIYDTGMEGVGEVTCRVLYDAESPYNLQIITDDCIKKNGEYVYIPFGSMNSLKYKMKNFSTSGLNEQFLNYDFSEWYKYESREVEEYNDVINILNEKAMEFYNNTYAIDARCVGSNPINKEKETKRFAKLPENIIKELKEKDLWDTSKEDTGAKDEDDNYEIDYDALQNLNILTTNKHYWLASRYNEVGSVYFSSKGLIFYLTNDGGYEYAYEGIIKTHIHSSGNYNGELTTAGLNINAFRPVFTLKGNLKVVSGDGTSESTAYRLGV